MAAIANLLLIFLQLYSFIILARVLLSWFPNVDPDNPIVRFLYEATEPVLQPVRNFLRRQFPEMGMLDFSPIAVFLGIFVLQILIRSAFF
ncbi:MAG: YggT family protein [Anaerolineaceae bacterium]|nr:MAG: YggT family protein [Anaerolineaceae bacterium]